MLVFCSAGLFQQAAAQAIRGTVYLAPEQDPLADVLIHITEPSDFEASVVSRSDGSFLVLVPDAGEYLVSADRIGLAPLRATPVDVPARGAVDVSLTMSAEAGRIVGIGGPCPAQDSQSDRADR